MSKECEECHHLIINKEVELIEKFLKESYHGKQRQENGFICSGCMFKKDGDFEKNKKWRPLRDWSPATVWQEFVCWVYANRNAKI